MLIENRQLISIQDLLKELRTGKDCYMLLIDEDNDVWIEFQRSIMRHNTVTICMHVKGNNDKVSVIRDVHDVKYESEVMKFVDTLNDIRGLAYKTYNSVKIK